MELDCSLTVLGLPRSHWHCTFANFDWALVRHGPLIQRDVEAFLTHVTQGEAPHLLLTGPPGRGKSHIGVAAYRWAVARYGTQLAMWLSVPDFCDRVKASYSGAPDPFEDFEEARRLVVLDDLFGRDLTPHETSAVVYRLINTAYRNSAAVLITLNQGIAELAKRLPGHEVSRVRANAQVILMESDTDYRTRKHT